MLRQIEWGVQNGPITKNIVLPATTLFIYLFNLFINLFEILFQFKNLLTVDLMYQLPKCRYSYFL